MEINIHSVNAWYVTDIVRMPSSDQRNKTTLFVPDSFNNRRRQTLAYIHQGKATDTTTRLQVIQSVSESPVTIPDVPPLPTCTSL